MLTVNQYVPSVISTENACNYTAKTIRNYTILLVVPTLTYKVMRLSLLKCRSIPYTIRLKNELLILQLLWIFTFKEKLISWVACIDITALETGLVYLPKILKQIICCCLKACLYQRDCRVWTDHHDFCIR